MVAFLYIWCPIWCPYASPNLHRGPKKREKKTVFQGLKTQNDLENMFKVVFGEKILWGTFPDTYLVPYLVPTGFEAKMKRDFWHHFIQECDFSLQNSDSGGTK